MSALPNILRFTNDYPIFAEKLSVLRFNTKIPSMKERFMEKGCRFTSTSAYTIKPHEVSEYLLTPSEEAMVAHNLKEVFTLPEGRRGMRYHSHPCTLHKCVTTHTLPAPDPIAM